MPNSQKIIAANKKPRNKTYTATKEVKKTYEN
jgi:hypothetical protein